MTFVLNFPDIPKWRGKCVIMGLLRKSHQSDWWLFTHVCEFEESEINEQ